MESHGNRGTYTDSFLYGQWRLARNRILSERARSYTELSPWNKFRFCMELEEAYTHDCPCIKTGCKALKTVKPMPHPITDRGRPRYKVMDLSGRDIPRRSMTSMRAARYDPIKGRADSVTHLVYNEHLFLFPYGLTRKLIQVVGLWENPMDIAEARYCRDESDCWDPLDMPTGMDEANEQQAFQLAMQLMGYSLKNDETRSSQTAL